MSADSAEGQTLVSEMRQIMPEVPIGGDVRVLILDLPHEDETATTVGVRDDAQLDVDAPWESVLDSVLRDPLVRLAESREVTRVAVRGAAPPRRPGEVSRLVPVEVHLNSGESILMFLERGRRAAAIPIRSGSLLEPLPPGADDVRCPVGSLTELEQACRQAGFDPFDVLRGAASLIGQCTIAHSHLRLGHRAFVYAGLHFRVSIAGAGVMCEVTRLATETPVIRVHATAAPAGRRGNPWTVDKVMVEGERAVTAVHKVARVWPMLLTVALVIQVVNIPGLLATLQLLPLPPNAVRFYAAPVVVVVQLYVIAFTLAGFFLRTHRH